MNKDQIILMISLSVLLFGNELALSQVPKFNSANVGSGPLLFFVHPEDLKGRSVSGGIGYRDEVIYIFDPTTNKQPQVLWRGQNPRPQPLHRLDHNTVLFEYKNHLIIVDLTDGKVSPILSNSKQEEFVTVEGSKVYFLEKLIEGTFFSQLELGKGESNKTIVKDYCRPCDNLYFLDRSKPGKPKRLTDLEIERILAIDKNFFWVITCGKESKLYRLEKNGKAEVIIPFNPHWVTPETYPKFSPDKKYLALGLINDQNDFHSERELVVIDMEQKNIVFKSECIPILDIFSGNITPLIFDWIEDAILYYILYDKNKNTFKWIFWDAEKKIILDEERAKHFMVRLLSVPETSDRKTRGYFDLKFGLVFFKGQETPVGNVLNDLGHKINDMAICPKGEWAAFVSPEDNNIYIIDGKNKKTTLFLFGWSYDLKWCAGAAK